jgi:2-furoyl-CoA dehydrogenase FAD binding subunit
MKPAPFDYHRPESLEDALALLAQYRDDAVLLAGGLSLGPMLNMRLVAPAVVVDINRLQGLDTVESDGGWLRTGALVRQADALRCIDAVPLLKQALAAVGHYQTRSRGTLGGSVAHADPSAEIPLCLVTLGGEVELQSSEGRRRIAASDFFQGALMTGRASDEMVTALYWPLAAPESGFAFREVSQRHGDFAIVAAAAEVRHREDRFVYALGFGGLEDRPVACTGEAATLDGIADSFVATLSAMEDPHVSAEYRAHLAAHLGAQVLAEAAQ